MKSENTMSLIEIIRKRYSARKYARRPISQNDINECLEASRLAPSACNCQPWQFIVVDTPELKDRLASAMLQGIYGLNTFIKEAPVLIVIITEKTKWFPEACNFIRDTRLYLIDIGIACEHFVLRATELGIGTCIMGWFNEAAVKKLLGISKRIKVELILSMGYPADNFIPIEKNRKKLSEISKFM